jgi:hypothetical protein
MLCIEIFMALATSICVVPLTHISTFYAACGLMPVEKWKGGQCFKASTEIPIAIFVTVLLLVYLWVVIAFAVVGGDPQYVQRSELFYPLTWATNAHLKTDSLRLGYLHLNGPHAFRMALSFLFVKVLLPGIDVVFKHWCHWAAQAQAGVVFCSSVVILCGVEYSAKLINSILGGVVLATNWLFVVAVVGQQAVSITLQQKGAAVLVGWVMIGCGCIAWHTMSHSYSSYQAMSTPSELRTLEHTGTNAMHAEEVRSHGCKEDPMSRFVTQHTGSLETVILQM